MARRRAAASGPRSCPEGRRRRVAPAARVADDIVEFYDPTDVFGDLAEALAEAFPAVAPELDAEDAEIDARTATTPKPRRTTRTLATPSDEADADDAEDAKRPDGAARPRDMRLAAAELVESREILPGQWLQTYHAPWPGVGRAGRPVRPRPDARLLGARPAPAVLDQHVRPATGDRHDPLPGHRRRHGVAGRGCGRATPCEMLGPLGRGRSRSIPDAAPAARRRRARHGRRAVARRRGAPRRAPGGAAVRRGELRREVYPSSCCPTRSSTSSRPTTARSAIAAS